MSISRFSLGIFRRLRNLKHIMRLPEDIRLIQHNQAIEEGYLYYYHNHSQFFKNKFLRITQALKDKH